MDHIPIQRDFDKQLSVRLKEFLLFTFGTIDRAIVKLQVASGTMYSYLPPAKSSTKRKRKWIYPSVGFIKKLTIYGCDAHWLVTGEGEMLVDKDDRRIPGYPEKKRQAVRILAEHGIYDNDKLIEELSILKAMKKIRDYLVVNRCAEPDSLALKNRTETTASEEQQTRQERA